MVQQMAIYNQGCKLMVGAPLLCLDKQNNLPLQDAGQGVLSSE